MSEPAVEESNLQEDTELENDTELGENTELEGQDAEPTQTMPPSRKVGRYFSNGHTFNIGHDTWELSGKPISDKEFDNFSRAVFKCKPIKGKHKNRAVVKIWMQTENDGYDSQHSNDSGIVISQDLRGWEEEASALRTLQKAYEDKKGDRDISFRPFPSLIGMDEHKQKRGQDLPLPGGYLIYLVMEEMPGDCISVDEFKAWKTVAERKAFRDSLEKTIKIIRKLGVGNDDAAMRNLLYDKTNKKCYHIDWEKWSPRKCDGTDNPRKLLYSYDMIRDRGMDREEGVERWDYY